MARKVYQSCGCRTCVAARPESSYHSSCQIGSLEAGAINDQARSPGWGSRAAAGQFPSKRGIYLRSLSLIALSITKNNLSVKTRLFLLSREIRIKNDACEVSDKVRELSWSACYGCCAKGIRNSPDADPLLDRSAAMLSAHNNCAYNEARAVCQTWDTSS
jgi:hypothetical protein